MVLIFSASGDSQSFPRSSRIIGPFLHWLLPNLSDASIKDVVSAARKCAHLTEYAVLAFLVWRARRKPLWRQTSPWQWRPAIEALWVTMFYAATDEFHQTFIPSREGCLRDVIIDSSGAVIGLIVLWRAGRLFKRW
jgi:VanZ family protein